MQGRRSGCSIMHRNLWGSFTIPPNYAAILGQTNGEHFYTRDSPVGGSAIGATCQQPASATNHPPTVSVVLADGTQATLTATGQILDTGGVDWNSCGVNENESLAWRPSARWGL